VFSNCSLLGSIGLGMQLVSCPINNVAFAAIKNGPSQGVEEGAYLIRYVTDEATQAACPFSSQPFGRGQVGGCLFSALQKSLLTYHFR